jgi:hypothetical protein
MRLSAIKTIKAIKAIKEQIKCNKRNLKAIN